MLLPLSWLLAAILAAAFHEICHWIMIRILTKEAVPLHIFSFGAKLSLPPMSRKRELLCALAGPLGGLSLLLIAKWLPRTSICAAIQSLYNLLPIYPLDGGRAFDCILSMLMPPPKVQRAMQRIEKGILLSILLLAIYGSVFQKLGLMPLYIVGFLFLRLKMLKMPCKLPHKRVQ